MVNILGCHLLGGLDDVEQVLVATDVGVGEISHGAVHISSEVGGPSQINSRDPVKIALVNVCEFLFELSINIVENWLALGADNLECVPFAVGKVILADGVGGSWPHSHHELASLEGDVSVMASLSDATIETEQTSSLLGCLKIKLELPILMRQADVIFCIGSELLAGVG